MGDQSEEKSVLVMCTNPTTDGYYELLGHRFVAYVDVTPVIKTQAEHRAQLQQWREKVQPAFDEYTRLIAHPDKIPEQTDPEAMWIKSELKDVVGEGNLGVIRYKLDTSRYLLDMIKSLERIPLPVEELSKIYYKGIDSVPAGLKVDVVFASGCVHEADRDLIKAIQRHLRPGGQLYLTVSDPSNAEKMKRSELYRLFAPEIKVTTLPVNGPYFEARRELYEDQQYVILTRPPAAGGGRRKTFRRKSKKLRMRTRK